MEEIITVEMPCTLIFNIQKINNSEYLFHTKSARINIEENSDSRFTFNGIEVKDEKQILEYQGMADSVEISSVKLYINE